MAFVCVQEKQKDYEKQLAVERKKRLAERKEKRKEERRAKWLQEKEEAAQKARDEQLKKGEWMARAVPRVKSVHLLHGSCGTGHNMVVVLCSTIQYTRADLMWI